MLSPAARPLPLRPAAPAYDFFNRHYEILGFHVSRSKQTAAPFLIDTFFGLLSEPHGGATAYNPPMAFDALERASREKRWAALASVGSAILLVSLKIFIAVRTGSLGILSETLHSILDLVAAVITYLSVRVADKPADADHLYGHGKVESFSAFVETALLLFTAVYIIWEAFQRLFRHAESIHPSLTAIIILLCCMGIDFFRSRGLNRVARKYPSEALEADALHFSTDVWSTFVVILGISGAWLGLRYGVPWLGKLDAIAAPAGGGGVFLIR